MRYLSEDNADQRRRSDAGILQITERDIHALTWIAEQYCICFDHLRILLGRNAKAKTKQQGVLSESATRNALNRWYTLGLIDYPRKILHTHPAYIWLSRKGVAFLNNTYPYLVPKPSTISHIHAVNTVRLKAESYLNSTWVARRRLQKLFDEPTQPDAELWINNQPHTAIEVIGTPLLFLKDELSSFEVLSKRQYRNRAKYDYFCYYVHEANVPLFLESIVYFPLEMRENIRIFEIR